MNDFVRERMDWLVAISADPKHHAWLPVAVAGLLVARYFNSRTGKAWPGIERIADDLNADRRNVQRVLDALVEHGYLTRERNRKRGAGYTNIYEMRFPTAASKGGSSTAVNEGRSIDPERAVYKPGKGGRGTARSIEEPRSNLRSSPRAREEDVDSSGGREASSRKSPEASVSTRAPTFNEEHADEASAIARWDHDRAQREYKNFRGWHRDHPGHFMSWSRWCEQGKKLDARNMKPDNPRRSDHAPSRQKDFEAARGGLRWLERRRAASEARYVSAMEEIDDD